MLSRSFVVGCQDALWWVVKIFCGGLSKIFVVGCQDLLWWVVKMFSIGLPRLFLPRDGGVTLCPPVTYLRISGQIYLQCVEKT